MIKSLLLYIPVLHNGYLRLFDRCKGKIKYVYLFDDELVSELSEFREIRAIAPSRMVKMINSLALPFKARLLNKKNIKTLSAEEIIAVGDSITKKFIKKYAPHTRILFENVFLRWDEGNVVKESTGSYDVETTSQFDRKMMKKAIKIGGASSDWWRHVGCVIVKNKRVLISSFNQHFPTNDTQYIEGDPRDFIKAGKFGFLASSAHAEQLAIAKAANKGIQLKGADMYVSTYPCPACAKLTAAAGIKRCFFQGGNSYLDVEAVFKATGLKAVLVK
jgi:dCMP deaminase